MNKKSDLLYTFLHLPTDLLAVTLAFVMSYWLKSDGLEIYRLPYSDYLQLVYVGIPLWLLAFGLQGMYSRPNLFGTLTTSFRLAIASLTAWATFIVYLTFLKTEATFVFPRRLLVYILILGFVYTLLGRLFLRFVQYVARRFGIGKRRTLIMGSSEAARTMEQELQSSDDVGRQFLRRIETVSPEELAQTIKSLYADDVIIADHKLGDTQLLEYMVAVQDAGAVCHFVPNMFEVQASNVSFTTLGGVPALSFRQTPLDGWGRIAKRTIDIVLALLGLIILSPVFLVISLIILITDPGPIIYPHERISRGGKKFKLLKFRSMILKYCTGPGFNPKSQVEIFTEMGRMDLVEEFKRDHKVQDDPRISRIGKLLRKTRLDELPQLINVIRGDLSLVGPRAITTEELNRYGRWGSYLKSIKPGLTGLWQVSGSSSLTYDERVKLDTYYVQNWSLLQDFIIMIKTVITVFGGGDGV